MRSDLGFKQKLQRAIAESRQRSTEIPQPLVPKTPTAGFESQKSIAPSAESQYRESSHGAGQGSSDSGRTKRKYKRHPKASHPSTRLIFSLDLYIR
jgi:hypothetical protein